MVHHHKESATVAQQHRGMVLTEAYSGGHQPKEDGNKRFRAGSQLTVLCLDKQVFTFCKF